MERHGFGLGEYKYFKYPLPDLIERIRKEIYPKLTPIANTWMKALNIERQFPNRFDEFQRLCHDKNQTKPTVLILKYGKGGYNTLHQDLYGDIFFPIQLVLFLNEPGYDYTGGVVGSPCISWITAITLWCALDTVCALWCTVSLWFGNESNIFLPRATLILVVLVLRSFYCYFLMMLIEAG